MKCRQRKNFILMKSNRTALISSNLEQIWIEKYGRKEKYDEERQRRYIYYPIKNKSKNETLIILSLVFLHV